MIRIYTPLKVILPARITHSESFTQNTEIAYDEDVMIADEENVPTQSQNDIHINRVVSNNKLESVKDERQLKDRCIYPNTIPENSPYSNMVKSGKKVVFCRIASAKV